MYTTPNGNRKFYQILISHQDFVLIIMILVKNIYFNEFSSSTYITLTFKWYTIISCESIKNHNIYFNIKRWYKKKCIINQWGKK